MIKTLASFALAAALTGCATQPPMTRDQTVAATTRVYAGLTPRQVLDAAERVLRLADESDFTFAYGDNSLTAMRKWMLYLVLGASIGSDHWQITAEQIGPDTRLRAIVATTQQDIMPLSITPAVWVPMTMPADSRLVQGTAIYDAFFARVDYMVGLRPTWMSCKEADARVSAGQVHGTNEALCNSFNMADATPSAPMLGAQK